jgi:hypothetical protein
MTPLKVALLALFLLVAERASASPRLGAAVFKDDTVACVTFRGEPLRAGSRVLLVVFSTPRVVDGRIRGRSKSPCNESVPLEGESYTVAAHDSLSLAGEVCVAVYDPSARVEFLKGAPAVHTEGTKAPLRFRQCASGEGLHLTAWRENRRAWHEYWYVGFDLEPDCSDEEVGE